MEKSEALVHFDLEGVAAVLIPDGAYGEFLRDLVFHWNDLPRARREVGRESKKQVLGYALLDGQPASAIALRSPNLRINGRAT